MSATPQMSHAPSSSRTFAPDDFKRERPARYSPSPLPSGSGNRSSSRPPPITSQWCTRREDSDDLLGEHQMLSSSPSLNHFMIGEGHDSNSRALDGSSIAMRRPSGQADVQLQEWQDQADQDWIFQKDRRRSEGGLLYNSNTHSSLAKGSLMVKSPSTQTLTSLSSDPYLATQQAQPSRVYDSPSQPNEGTPYRPSPPSSTDYYILDAVTFRSDDARPSPELRQSVDAMGRAYSVVSSMSSSRFSVGAESTHGLLSPRQKSSSNDGIMAADLDTTSGTASRRIKSMHFSQQAVSPSLPPLETSNHLSNQEKSEQIKRSLKLATMLGDEWWRQGDAVSGYADGVNSGNTSPLKGYIGRKTHRIRRKSEPMQGDGLGGNDTERSSYRRPSDVNQLVNLNGDTYGAAQFPLSSLSGSASVPLSPLPQEVHPKAAALLGLSPPPVIDSGEQVVKTDKLSSSSQLEMLADSDPRMSMCTEENGEKDDDGGEERAADEATIYDEEDPHSLTANASREERRRRVKKISRWLGAVVPPHLVQPYSDIHEQSATGYGKDEAPSSALTDYTSGTPLHASEKASGSATKPLSKAKAAVNAKLHRRTMTDQSGDRLSSQGASQQLPASRERAASSILRGEERMTNVKRNHKLTAVFGEAVPVQLISAEGSAQKDGQSPLSYSYSLSRGIEDSQAKGDLTAHSISPGRSDSPLPRQAAHVDAGYDRRASNQYRLSLDSLEYLMMKNPPLLKDLVRALEEDEDTPTASPIGPGEGMGQRGTTWIAGNAQESFLDTRSEEDEEEEGEAGNDSLHNADSSRDDSIAEVSPNKEGKERETKIRRNQKLGRWFGELPPQQSDNFLDETRERRLAGSRGEAAAAAASATVPASESTSSRPSSSRMAPRSAGSALLPLSLSLQQHRHALGRILTSIEGEVRDDEGLQVWEKKELRDRLRQLRKNSESAW